MHKNLGINIVSNSQIMVSNGQMGAHGSKWWGTVGAGGGRHSDLHKYRKVKKAFPAQIKAFSCMFLAILNCFTSMMSKTRSQNEMYITVKKLNYRMKDTLMGYECYYSDRKHS